MTFPTNNLPTQSKFWGREVEKKITNLENSFKSAEINNTTRDSQLSVTAGQALAAANQANAAAAQAQTAADDAAEAASLAGTAAGNAQNAINGLVGLGEPGSAYDVAAGNISAGTVTGLSITGGSLNTAAVDGKSVSVAGTRVDFKSGSSSVANLEVTGDGKMGVFGSGLYLSGGATGTGVYGTGGLGVGDGSITTNYNVTAGGTVIGETVMVGGSNGATLSEDGSGRIASNTGFLANGPLGVTGNLTYAAPTGTGTTFPLYWNSSSNLVYRLSSSQRYKTDIQDASFDYSALLQAKVRTFKNQQDVDDNGLENAELTYGYIAEELDALGLSDFVVYEPDENGNLRPESVNYMSMALASHEMLKVQDQKLKSLEARLEALESR